MSALVFDADIVSTFSKIRKLHLLKALFPDQEFYLPLSVQEDLLAAKEAGYEFTNYLWDTKLFKVISHTEEETALIAKLRSKKPSLGLGQITCIVVGKCRGWIVVTNDVTAKNECERQDVKYIDLSAILRALWRERIIPQKDVEKLIDEIEQKDRVKIKNKKEILKE